jgi:hypothetical protein
MFPLKLPHDLGDLLLTPQWAGLSPVLQYGLIAAVCLVPLALVLWLYRYELQLVTRLTARTLLGLRLAVLLTILGLVCLQPIYAWTKTDGLPGRILIAVDRSDSMDIADPQRPVADKLRLARGLHLGGDVSDELLASWIADHDANREPQWLAPEEKKMLDEGAKRTLAVTRRQAHDRICSRVDELTRTGASIRILSDDGVRLLRALTDAGHQIELVGFHRDAWEVKPQQFSDLFRKDEEKEKKEPAVKPAGEAPGKEPLPPGGSAYTDLRLPLVRALERSEPGKGDVLGIVLLTDGQHNTGEPPTAKAKELGERGMPIYPIALGARQPPPDAAVVSIQAPPAVFKDVEVPIDVHFKVTGLKAQDFLVELHRTGKEKKLLAQRTVHHDGKDRAYMESFPIQMDEVGTQTLTATIKPLDPETKETRADNNSRLTTLNVADDKAKVLLIDGEARWEFHYLQSALKRDRTMQVESVVFHQPRLDDRLTPEELHKMGSPRQKLPVGPDALADYDCIILGDVAPAQLPLAERVRLEKYVAERGGTLVVLPGKRSMPLGYPEVEGSGEVDPLRKLLPVEGLRAVAPREGFPVSLTQAGRETKFMEMDPEKTKSEQVWAALQRHYWGLVGQTKPGATALAWYADEVDTKSPAERERQNALMAWHHYGFGRVLFVGLDSTWRWRFKVGDLYHHTFWGAAIRWAAADKPLMAGNDFLRFGTPQPVYGKDDEVKVVVRLNDALGPVKPDLLAGARILLQGGPGEKEKAVALLPLARREAQPRVLEGKVSGLAPGQYNIELVIPDLADKLRAPGGPPGSPEAARAGEPLRAHFTLRPPDSPEMIDLHTRWPLLEEIAAKSGGKVFAAEDAGALVELLAKKSVPHVERHEQRLWLSWWMLGLVVGLLTLEWAGRKLAGLP